LKVIYNGAENLRKLRLNMHVVVVGPDGGNDAMC